MSKQTAVEWLVDELLSGKPLMPSLIEQAKQMEKKQIEDAYLIGLIHDLTKDAYTQAEEYYKENYGGDHE
jgi:HD superfamily phosphohydrolase YqeK